MKKIVLFSLLLAASAANAGFLSHIAAGAAGYAIAQGSCPQQQQCPVCPVVGPPPSDPYKDCKLSHVVDKNGKPQPVLICPVVSTK